jgi:hypothetical protein
VSGALGSILSGGAGTGLAGGTALTLLSPLTGTGVNALSQVLPASLVSLIRQPRALGSGISALIPDVTVEEHFTDRVQPTVHPLATGSPITDHVFRQPKGLTMKLGWTNAAPLVGAVQGAIAGAGGTFPGISASGLLGGLEGAGMGALNTLTEQRAAQIYKQLLKMQFDDTNKLSPVTPFNVTAGKRTYKNMIITELNCTNTAATEYALIIEVTMTEVLMIQAQPANLTQQQAPQKTGSTTSTGNNSTAPQATPSQALSIWNSITGNTTPAAPATPQQQSAPQQARRAPPRRRR